MTGAARFQQLRRWLAERAFRYLFLVGLLGVGAFIGLVWAVNFKLGIALVIITTLVAVDLYGLQRAMLPVFFAIPFERLGKLGPESVMTWAKLLIAVLIVAWVVHLLIEKDPRPTDVLFHSPLFLLATLSLGLSFLSVLNAREYAMFWAQTLRRVNNFILFILIATIVDSATLVRRLLVVFLLAYFFVGLTVMYEIDTGKPILEAVWGEKAGAFDEYSLKAEEFRVGGPSGDPDFLAVSVILPGLLAATLFFEPISRLIKVALVLPVMLMMLVTMLATGSRGGLLALIIGAGIFWLLTPMRYKVLIPVVAIVLVVGLVALLSVTGTSSAERFSGEAGGKSLVYRLGWTKMAIMMIHDHPWVGVGTGHFPMQYNRYSRTVPTVPRQSHWTHNSFLQMWAENGLFALVVYLGIYLAAAMAMVKVIATTTDPALRRLAVLMLSAVCGYFEFAGTSNVLENENYWIVFALVTVISALAREHAREHPARPSLVGSAPDAPRRQPFSGYRERGPAV